MRISLNHPDGDGCVTESDGADSSIFQPLLYTVLQKPREQDPGGVVIALSSSNPGEGVTSVARSLLHEVAKSELTSAAGVNVGFLRKLHEPTMEAIRKTAARPTSRQAGEGQGSRDARHSLAVPERRSPWEGSWHYRRDCIDLLRAGFDYTIIDCPSLRESADLLSVAPFVDGVILVAEANRTRREQPRQAEQRIRAAGGTLLGYILNKRTYEAPRWLYPDA